jgi:hypothetical protein
LIDGGYIISYSFFFFNRVYQDGVLTDTWAESGDLSTWSSTAALRLGNEGGLGAQWTGTLYKVNPATV